ncbi:Uncharacterised protein [Mycobacteroides abscessus subsp. abscessus]|nr:Uncharacterised protein [Mycobacteroides abscessus subsp. abscessus]
MATEPGGSLAALLVVDQRKEVGIRLVTAFIGTRHQHGEHHVGIGRHLFDAYEAARGGQLIDRLEQTLLSVCRQIDQQPFDKPGRRLGRIEPLVL